MTIFNVSTAAELENALNKATGGDEIRLAGGDYGELDLSNTKYTSNVTIKSADTSSIATFSGLSVDQASNITFDTILFDYEYSAGDNVSATRFEIVDSDNITIINSVFDGDFASGTGTTADGAGYGRGLRVKGSSEIDIVDSEFHSWWKAININDSSDVNFTGNDIHTIRSDGLNVGQSENVLIENNHFHDFGAAAGSDDHRDMIQIKRSSGEGSDGITIRNNVFDMGTGDYTQTIFAGGDGAVESDPNGWHTDIVIEGNIIYNAHTHGITISMTDGVDILNNTVIAVPRDKDGGVTIPKIFVSSESKNVTIEQNVAAGVNGYEGQSDWSVNNNVSVQNDDPSAPGYYDDMFIYYATAAKDGYNQFGVKPGSIIDQLNAGSSLVDLYPASYEDIFGGSWVVDKDSGTVDDPVDSGSAPDPVNPDTGSDPVVDEGPADAPVDESTGGGATDKEGAAGGDTIDDAASFLGSFDDFVLNIAAGLDDNDQVKRTNGDVHVEFDGATYGIVYDGNKDTVNLGRLRQFEDSEQVAYTVEFARNEADGSEQRVVWNHKKLGLTLEDDGLIVKVGSDNFRVDDIGLNDTDLHRISVLVDQDSDRLQVLVDDMLVLDETETDLDFVGNGGREWGWKLGTPWSRDVDGTITDFRVDDDVAFVDDAAVVPSDLVIA